jgi:hypothetical protein
LHEEEADEVAVYDEVVRMKRNYLSNEMLFSFPLYSVLHGVLGPGL